MLVVKRELGNLTGSLDGCRLGLEGRQIVEPEV